jgi:hypothetical protein
MRSTLGSTNRQTFLLLALAACALVKRWVLRAQRATEVPFLGAAPHATGEVFVAARCYRRDQRP